MSYHIAVRKTGDLNDYWLSKPRWEDGALNFTPASDRATAAEFDVDTARALMHGASGEGLRLVMVESELPYGI